LIEHGCCRILKRQDKAFTLPTENRNCLFAPGLIV
jgi:hypothetical protein